MTFRFQTSPHLGLTLILFTCLLGSCSRPLQTSISSGPETVSLDSSEISGQILNGVAQLKAPIPSDYAAHWRVDLQNQDYPSGPLPEHIRLGSAVLTRMSQVSRSGWTSYTVSLESALEQLEIDDQLVVSGVRDGTGVQIHPIQANSTHLIYFGDPNQTSVLDVAVALATLQLDTPTPQAISDRANDLLDATDLVTVANLNPVPTDCNLNYVDVDPGPFSLVDVAAILARLQVGPNPAAIANRINELLAASGLVSESDIGFIPGVSLPGPCPTTTSIVINELDYDQAGVEIAEFVELYDGGSGNTPLDGLTLVFFNGAAQLPDLAYRTFDLSGQTTDAEGYFVLCGDSASVNNCDLDVTPDFNILQNQAEAVAVYQGPFENFTPPTTLNLIDAVVYGNSDPDESLVNLFGVPQVSQGGIDSPNSIGRLPNGTGTVQPNPPTPGEANVMSLPSPSPGPSPTPPSIPLFINEFDYDQAGGEGAEFVEIYDGGVGNTSLNGLTLVFFDGDFFGNDLSLFAFDLSGESTNAEGYFVLCGDSANVSNCDLDVMPDFNLLQNVAEAIALYQGPFSVLAPPSTANLVDAVVYGNGPEDASLVSLFGGPQVNQGGVDSPNSVGRIPDGSGAFQPNTLSPGGANSAASN